MQSLENVFPVAGRYQRPRYVNETRVNSVLTEVGIYDDM
jgi:hypothetical protein